ncbi:MAG: twin-arginine translocation signal domain-containing protein, partial [Gemmatimonadetes bacterium]|nr:twin-arginine translocation signal domain-containing protein [Gemmatimonadota bacterium]
MTVSRRRFLAHAGGCAGYLAVAGPLLPEGLRARWFD